MTRSTMLTVLCALSVGLLAAEPRRTVGVIDFQNTPMIAVVEYVAQNLLDKPLITSPYLYGYITYRSPRDLTVPEAITELTGALGSNGWQLIEVDARYYRLRPMSETNRPPDSPHVEVAIEKNQVRVDDEPVVDIAAAAQKRLTNGSELWIYDANSSTNMNFDILLATLSHAGVNPRKVMRAYVPRH